MTIKIPIEITEEKRCVVNTLIASPFIPKGLPIQFTIDTGSPTTMISEYEAKNTLSIDISKLKRNPKSIGGFGEGTTGAYTLPNICLCLVKEDGGLFQQTFDQILIIEKSKRLDKKKGGKIRKYMIPNVIGVDFFLLSGLKMFIDFKNKIAYFEK
ncbi:MAG: retropepsin-like domain-containing protein [Candidatus Thermoplasmatota archaeon]|nr:hypothetical protein [Euryarchaeota archaeon]MBU4031337.1 retropepsin-like domain-containing protein [Candidatus Thermoplasmatota archaeon]MBU4071389.1 retropepsin-like domain-containing protein [Candidatus Thermoplasmatota archaeon]MBU4143493.1 retropepsin-like domain-containing protein [Candidatus Thermoplasmatota archaeon]MBU4591727.1 retropepsin-like domain-containing protein [Candidatus Thermoplasmatota archaeon]